MNNDAIHSWQKQFMQALISPETTSPETIAKHFVAQGQLSATASLHLYQRGYILRLKKCLAEQFPALAHALGEALFSQFAERYLSRYPSNSYTLYELGNRFANFLEEDRPDKTLPAEQRETWIDFMVDLAQFENLHFQLFDAPGHEGKNWPMPNTPDADLQLQPCFALAQYRYPVAWYYHAVKQHSQQQTTQRVKLPKAQLCYLALLRKDFQVTTFPITAMHYQFLSLVKTHNNINKALEVISEQNQIPIAVVQQSWQKEVKMAWLNAGFFVCK